MPDAAIYGEWESSRANWTERSYLYALAPIGVGTAAVESLTGYIARLAAAHAVETGVLVNHELLRRVPYTKGRRPGRVPSKLPRYSFFIDAHTLNGIGDRARLWVSLLEQLTCIPRLDLLTALPWAKAISCVHMLRTIRSWCPFCYGAVRSPTTVYERLLWAFQVVTTCPHHGCPLDSICPFCGRTQYVFSSRSRPGYCSRCQCWLGRQPEHGNLDGDPTGQIPIAEMVGEMLAAGPSLPAGFGIVPLQENIRQFVRSTGGNLQLRATLEHRHIRGWMTGRNAPRMDSLVALSRSRAVSIARLLTERISAAKDIVQRRSSHSHPRVADNVVEEALRAALVAEFPPPLTEVATHLGYRTVASLQSRYSGLCAKISRKRESAPKVRPLARVIPVSRDRIEKALREALNKDGPTPLLAVAGSVGLRNKRRLYKGFHDLRRAVVAKNKRIREERVATIETAMRAALDERPIPSVTEVARRFGVSSVTRITTRFPELSAQLRCSHQRDHAIQLRRQ
jgi:hypothetical protein